MKEDNEAVIKALNMFGRVPEQWELLNEIERLNNIINEFDKWLENEIKFQGIVENAHFLRKARIKLQELKGSAVN